MCLYFEAESLRKSVSTIEQVIYQILHLLDGTQQLYANFIDQIKYFEYLMGNDMENVYLKLLEAVTN